MLCTGRLAVAAAIGAVALLSAGCGKKNQSEGNEVKPVVEVCALPAVRVAALVRQAAAKAIADRGAFSIAIAGGSLVKMLGGMADLPDVEWDKWFVAWVDERCVPHSDPDSNYGGAKKAWLSKVPIPPDHIFPIDEAVCQPAEGEAAGPCATDYERRLRALPEDVLPRGKDGLPAFDLLLLGFGPDGHICSLFPGHPLLDDASGRWILPITDSPKPPPQRITFSLPAVNAASQVILVGTGDGKKEVVRDAFKPGCDLPCRRALGAAPETRPPTFVLDEAAAALLPPDGEERTFKKRIID